MLAPPPTCGRVGVCWLTFAALSPLRAATCCCVLVQLAGVTIRVEAVDGSGTLPQGSDGSTEPVSATTDAEGGYAVGPLHRGIAYHVTASKPGYFFEPAANDGVVADGASGMDFVHRRLGRVTVSAVDSDGQAVAGVVLSLSRDRYRHNNATQADGAFTFEGLFPGSYAVRPILKVIVCTVIAWLHVFSPRRRGCGQEYTFSPPSQTVEVEEGGDHATTFVANRVAFSCFGSVTSLNGRPQAGVVVTAVAADAPMEETTTDEAGRYRLRGLKPGTSYDVSVSPRGGSSSLERCSPPTATVVMGNSDRTDVDFAVFYAPSKYARVLCCALLCSTYQSSCVCVCVCVCACVCVFFVCWQVHHHWHRGRGQQVGRGEGLGRHPRACIRPH